MKNIRIVFAAPWTVEIREEPVREELAPDEVLIETLASVISQGTEMACLSGGESWFKMPGTPGYAQMGRVVAVGSAITRVKPGQCLINYGAHQKYNIIRDQWDPMLLPIPADQEQDMRLAFTRMVTVAFTGVRVSQIELGDAVAVTGMGLVGNFAAQLAALQGGTVCGVDRLPRRLEIAKACGIRQTFLADSTDLTPAIRQWSGGAGVRTVIEATGNPRVAVNGLGWIGRGGEMVLLGSPRGEFQGDITNLLNHVHLWGRGCVDLKGAHEWRFPTRATPHVKHTLERNSIIVGQLIRDGRLRVDELISHRIRPAQMPAAYAGMRENPNDYAGVLVDWR